MAYDPNNLSALSYANGFTLWHYKTPDGFEEVLEPGYFNRCAIGMFRKGDFVYANVGGEEHAIIVVADNFAGTVTVLPIGSAAIGQAARDAAA